MMIVLLIISYILIGVITGVVSFVFIMDKEYECEPAGFAFGIFWPITIPGYVIFKLLEFLICKVYTICIYIHDEGIHYYKGELSDCCSKCKYSFYVNNRDEMNNCPKRSGSCFASTAIACKYYKKSFWWRFKIRYNYNKNK